MRAEHRLTWNNDDAMTARHVYLDYIALQPLEHGAAAFENAFSYSAQTMPRSS